MSSTPVPVTANSSPFVPTTTPTIERANRLMSLRAHPGFPDALRIIQEMIQEASDASAEYPGWDTQQMVVLKVRHQATKELGQAFLVRISNAIQAGIDEGRAMSESLPAKTAEEALDQGDYVRRKMLEHFDEVDGRLPGTY
jgi:hypothetical protein